MEEAAGVKEEEEKEKEEEEEETGWAGLPRLPAAAPQWLGSLSDHCRPADRAAAAWCLWFSGAPHGFTQLYHASGGAAVVMAALLSACNRPSRRWVVTGAVTLRGEVRGVGGVREKVRSRRRRGTGSTCMVC